jgi:hypothetical protein
VLCKPGEEKEFKWSGWKVYERLITNVLPAWGEGLI